MSSTEEFAGAGFSIQPVRGVRAWTVGIDGLLHGFFHTQVWNTGTNEAVCNSSRKGHEEPHLLDDCLHGFYAYFAGSNDYRDKHGLPVSGIVEGFGRTVFGTRGFRCMKARIVALTLTAEVVGAERYVSDVEPTQSFVWYGGLKEVEAGYRTVGGSPKSAVMMPELADRVRLNYWSVPFFDTFDSMVAAYPPDKGEA